MKRVPLDQMPEFTVAFNRERYKSELAQGIFDLMRAHNLKRSELAELLGVSKGRVSQLLSGSENLGAETLADILLVLGRTPHLVMGTDFDQIRFPVDEQADSVTAETWDLGELTYAEEEGDKEGFIQGSFAVKSIGLPASGTFIRSGEAATIRPKAGYTHRMVRPYATFQAQKW